MKQALSIKLRVGGAFILLAVPAAALYGVGNEQTMKYLNDRVSEQVHQQVEDWHRSDDYRAYDHTAIHNYAAQAVKKNFDAYKSRHDFFNNRDEEHETEFIKNVPSWPVAANFYARHDLVQLEYSYLWATKSWSSSGRCQDASDLVFRQEPFRLKDILLASKLLSEELVSSGAIGTHADPTMFNPASRNHFLSLLADKCILFDGSTERDQLSINYARHYFNAEMSFGIQVPIVRRKNKLCLTSKLTPSEHVLLAKDDPLDLEGQLIDPDNPGLGMIGNEATLNPKFFSFYESFEEFFDDIMKRKGINFSRRDREIGLGDIMLFLNFDVRTRHCDRLIVGTNVILPSSRLRDTHKLWDPELGNEGYTVFNVFTSFLFEVDRCFNPHVFAQVGFSPSAFLERRIPMLKTYDGVMPQSGTKPEDEFMVFSDQVIHTSAFGPLRDAVVRNFSTRSERLKIRRGAEFTLRVGNIFDRVLFNKGLLDVYYDLRLKGKDYLGGCRQPEQEFDGSIYTDNSYQVAHKAGVRYTYTFDENWRLHAEFLHAFAGRNVMRTYEVAVALTADF